MLKLCQYLRQKSFVGPRSRSQLLFVEKLCHHLAPLLLIDFNVTLHKRLVQQYFEQVCIPEF